MRIARENQRRNGIGAEIDYLAADWCAPLNPDAKPFDLIVTNPPYIAAAEIAGLQAEIRHFEPRAALDGGADGLDCLRLILTEAADRLASGGHLVVEMGADQAESVTALASTVGAYRKVEIHKDYAGLDRIAHLSRN